MNHPFAPRQIAAAVASLVGLVALAGTAVSAHADDNTKKQDRKSGHYVTGDFHNHTTCSDGSLSLQKLVDKSANTFGLDWFVQSGHGGNSARNCTLAEDPFEPVPPALGLSNAAPFPPGTYPGSGQPVDVLNPRGPNQSWVSTLANGAAGIKGDVVLQGTVRSMWKWQEVQEFIYPVIEQESRNRNKPIFVGLEQVVPGHEHTSTAIIDGQLPVVGQGNANAVAQFEYCFDRADSDKSRGAANQWDCAVPGSTFNSLIDATARKILVAGGTGSGNAGHVKTVEGVKWMAANYPRTSYYVPAHLERAGVFNPNGNNGFNIEHLRDFNNAAPDVAFGFESMPGHQADPQRGSYSPNAVGGGTYGGTGVYAAVIGGVWDALLGEGRRWFFFGSSDYHNRGSFGPDQRESTADFFPGEYTRDHVLVTPAHAGEHKRTAFSTQDIVDGLRSGNSFVANGGLIDRLGFAACRVETEGKSDGDRRGKSARESERRIREVLEATRRNESFVDEDCAGMGETLEVRAGDDVQVTIVAHDPEGKNFAPYSFANPSLLQLGISVPLNEPVLDHIDLIGGLVTGKVAPGSANYAGLIGSPAASNASAALKATFNSASWKSLPGGWRVMSYRVANVTKPQYLRLRGSNLPPATPFETDSLGNPLLDFKADLKIPCVDAACPKHMVVDPTTQRKTSSFDVAAWSDLWFYGNPVFIEIAAPRIARK
jgi:hypothetical protein